MFVLALARKRCFVHRLLKLLSLKLVLMLRMVIIVFRPCSWYEKRLYMNDVQSHPTIREKYMYMGKSNIYC